MIVFYRPKIIFWIIQDSYLANRSETMQNIEQTIVELGDIFTQLATMVRQQEEMVYRYMIEYFDLEDQIF